MTNPTQHGQVPEALIDLIDAYAETRHRCGGVYNAKTEAARNAVIEDLREALSGVQALSAAPAGWKLVPVEPTRSMMASAVIFANGNAVYKNVSATALEIEESIYGEAYSAMLAASPTPPAPAEQQAAPKAAPGEQNTVPAEWLEQAYREGWAACRDAETIGEEAEDWAFGNSTANSRMIDAQQAAPKQEAQEPAARYTIEDVRKARSEGYRNGVESSVPSKITKEMRHAFREKYKEGSIWTDRLDIALEGMLAAAPQPAPDCHHRPRAMSAQP